MRRRLPKRRSGAGPPREPLVAQGKEQDAQPARGPAGKRDGVKGGPGNGVIPRLGVHVYLPAVTGKAVRQIDQVRLGPPTVGMKVFYGEGDGRFHGGGGMR